MHEKLKKLFEESVNEFKLIGIDILETEKYGKINIDLSKRNNKRYGCCKQEMPDKKFKTVTRKGFRKYVRYEKFELHNIEISPWVMELDDKIIKNTILHELIHCLPYCNNHGAEFKKYANMLNSKFGYNISRVGNKKEDYDKSNVQYKENDNYKYRIYCPTCGQEFFRQRLNSKFVKKYRCGRCKGKFEVYIK